MQAGTGKVDHDLLLPCLGAACAHDGALGQLPADLFVVRSFLLGVLEPRFVDFLVDQLLCRLHNRHTPAADRRDVHLPHVVLAVAVVVVLDDDFGAAFLSA